MAETLETCRLSRGSDIMRKMRSAFYKAHQNNRGEYILSAHAMTQLVAAVGENLADGKRLTHRLIPVRCDLDQIDDVVLR